MKVLVTGAHGLIGNLVYQHLAGQVSRYDVYGLDRSFSGSERTNPGTLSAVPTERFYQVDLADMDGLRFACRGMQAVIHLAADPGSSIWESLLHSNMIGAYNLFEACRLEAVRRVVFASSIVVHFGRRNTEPYRHIFEDRYDQIPADYQPIARDAPPAPPTLYAATKLWGEALAYHYMLAYGLSCLCVRIGWVVKDDRPPARHGRSVWCSYRDISQLFQKCLDAPEDIRYEIVYGFSGNHFLLVDLEHTRSLLGYHPQDCSEDYFDFG